MSMSAVPPSMGSVSDTSEPVRYAAMMPWSLKARSWAVSLAIRISDSRVTRINVSLLSSPSSAMSFAAGNGGESMLGHRQCWLKRRQVQALSDAVLDQLQMFRILDDVQVIRFNL